MKKFFCVILLLFMNGVGIAQFKSGEQVDGSFDSLLTMRISTASKYWETASQAPASVSIITSEDIKALGYRTLDEVLSSIRSFYITYDRNYTYLGVRGFGRPTDFNSRILLLVNGTSLNENFYGSAPVGTDFGINLNSVERIEVVCGPGSSLYGSGAMFAVINVITKKGVGVDGINLSYAYGSNKDSRFGITFGKEFENGIDVMLSGLWADIKGENIYYNEYDTDSTNFGIAENLDWDRFYSFLSTIKYKNMIFQGLMTRREKGIPTGAYGVNFNDPISSTVDRYLLFELRYEDDETSKLGTMGRIYYGDYYYTGTYPYDILWWDKTNGRWLGGEIRLRYDCDPSNRVIGGIEYISNFRADYKNWNEKEIVFDKNFPHSLISFYFQDQFQFLNTLSLTLGGRFDYYSTGEKPITPRIAIIYNPSKSSTLKVLYGDAFRVPNRYELFYEDPISNFKKSSGLEPEHIKTHEVVWEERIGKNFLGIVSLYNNTIYHLIDQVDNPADSSTQFKDVERSRAIGAEIGLKFRFSTDLLGNISYCYQYARDDVTKLQLSNSPLNLLKFSIATTLLQPFSLGFESVFDSGRKTISGIHTKSYILSNFMISFKTEKNSYEGFFGNLGQFSLTLLIRNLTNQTYSFPTGFEHLQDEFIQDGRIFNFQLEWAY